MVSNEPSRRGVILAGAAAASAVAISSAGAWAKPTITQAIGLPAAAASTPPKPPSDFALELLDYDYAPPTQWGAYTVESKANLPTVLRITYTGEQAATPTWLLVQKYTGKAANSGNGPGNTFDIRVDTAAVTLNGSPAPSLVSFAFAEGPVHVYYTITQPIQPGSVLDLPLTYTWYQEFYPDYMSSTDGHNGSLTVSALIQADDSDVSNDRATSPQVPITIIAGPGI